MSMTLEVLRHTPPWVYALFAYLVWAGAQRLRSGTRDLRRIAIAPAVFVVWGLAGLMGRPDPFAATLAHWLLGAAVGLALGSATRPALQIDRAQRRRVHLPGSAGPLLRNLAIFGAHYLLNVATALHPSSHGEYLRLDVYVSGFSAGYFIGWAVRFALAYRDALRIAPERASRQAAIRNAVPPPPFPQPESSS